MRRVSGWGVALLGVVLVLAGACGPAAAPLPAGAPASAAPAAVSPSEAAPAVAAAAAPAPPARPLVDVVVASPSRSLTQFPFYFGLKHGLFAEEGLNVTMMHLASPVAMAAMIDGQVGYGTAGGTAIRAAAAGRPVRLIAGGKSKPDWLLMVQPGISSVADLRGKRVGVLAPTGAVTLVTYEVFEKYGLGPADLEAINLHTSEGILQGLLARQVDAGLVGPPHSVIARREGLRSLLRTGDEVVLLQGGLATAVQRLQERPDEVEAVLRALLRSTRLMQADKAKAIPVLVEEYDLTPDVADGVYDEVVPDFVPDASAPDAVIQREIAAQEEATGQRLAVTPADVSDFGPLRRAQAAVGIGR